MEKRPFPLNKKLTSSYYIDGNNKEVKEYYLK